MQQSVPAVASCGQFSTTPPGRFCPQGLPGNPTLLPLSLLVDVFFFFNHSSYRLPRSPRPAPKRYLCPEAQHLLSFQALPGRRTTGSWGQRRGLGGVRGLATPAWALQSRPGEETESGSAGTLGWAGVI